MQRDIKVAKRYKDESQWHFSLPVHSFLLQLACLAQFLYRNGNISPQTSFCPVLIPHLRHIQVKTCLRTWLSSAKTPFCVFSLAESFPQAPIFVVLKLLFSFPFGPRAALGHVPGFLSMNPSSGQDSGVHTTFLLLSHLPDGAEGWDGAEICCCPLKPTTAPSTFFFVSLPVPLFSPFFPTGRLSRLSKASNIRLMILSKLFHAQPCSSRKWSRIPGCPPASGATLGLQ